MPAQSTNTLASTHPAESTLFRIITIGVAAGVGLLLILLVMVLLTTYNNTRSAILDQFHQQRIDVLMSVQRELATTFDASAQVIDSITMKASIQSMEEPALARVDLAELASQRASDWYSAVRFDADGKPLAAWPYDYDQIIQKGRSLPWGLDDTLRTYIQRVNGPALISSNGSWLIAAPVYVRRYTFSGFVVAELRWKTNIEPRIQSLVSGQENKVWWLPSPTIPTSLTADQKAMQDQLSSQPDLAYSTLDQGVSYYTTFVPVIAGKATYYLVLRSSESTAFDRVHKNLLSSYLALGASGLGIVACAAMLILALRRFQSSNVRRLETVNDALKMRAQQLEKISRVSRDLTATLSLKDLFERVVTDLRREFGYYHIAVMLLDGSALSVQAEAGDDMGAANAPTFKLSMEERSLNARAVQSRQLVRVDDVRAEEDFVEQPNMSRTRSELIVPLMIENDVLGTLDIQAATTAAFTNEDELALMGLANQIAIAIRNAELYEAAQSAKAEAETSNLLKSRFLANMSHELRTPLNSIIGYTELMHKGVYGTISEQQRNRLEKVQRNGQNLLALINDILDLSKIEAGKIELFIETFDPQMVMREVAQTVTPLIEQNGNTLELKCPDSLGTMHSDQGRLRQILFNLLSNASKFTQAGNVTFDANREQDASGKAWIVFHVIDTGIGISPEQMVNLFKEFVQADSSTTRKYGGTGLGLAISRRFSELMGGSITVRSQVGQGSTFTVRLPVTAPPLIMRPIEEPAEPRYEAALAEARAAALQEKVSVLVIDDDAAVRDIMANYLEREGIQVKTASSGVDGLQLAEDMRPTCITLDVMMPGVDGWSVLASLKTNAATADIPVIMLTMVNDKSRGYALGASDYLTKPIDWDRLNTLLRRYCFPHPEGTILVVEDDEATRETLRNSLEKDGWDVGEAENGRVALNLLDKGLPDLILLDLMMPEMDGFAFITAVRAQAQWRNIPIIVLTAMDLSSEERAKLSLSVEQVMLKAGFNQEKLLMEVRGLVMKASARRKIAQTAQNEGS